MTAERRPLAARSLRSCLTSAFLWPIMKHALFRRDAAPETVRGPRRNPDFTHHSWNA